MKTEISWKDFEKLDIRVGTITEVSEFPEAKRPAWRLVIDFGTGIGKKQSSAQITVHYKKEDLEGTQVLAVVNFPPKRIAGFMSECLVLGVYDEDNDVILLQPRSAVLNGQPVG